MSTTADYEKVEGGTAVPVLDVGVSGLTPKTIMCKGIIDTGADMTVISPSVIDSLDLLYRDDVRLAGFTGNRDVSTYYVNMSINNTVFEGICAARSRIRVTGIEDIKMAIGRDMINLWDLHLRGRTRSLLLEPWSTNSEDALDRV